MIFFKKNVFCTIKEECVNDYLNICKKNLVDSEIQVYDFWLPNRGDTADINIIQDTNNPARHQQNQEKEKNTDYCIENFPFEFFKIENSVQFHSENDSQKNIEGLIGD